MPLSHFPYPELIIHGTDKTMGMDLNERIKGTTGGPGSFIYPGTGFQGFVKAHFTTLSAGIVMTITLGRAAGASKPGSKNTGTPLGWIGQIAHP